MVRLKGHNFIKKFIFILKFQFLMVRLKGWSICFLFKCIHISIPYGAIKRLLIACRDNNGNDISIPYGAIKRK